MLYFLFLESMIMIIFIYASFVLLSYKMYKEMESVSPYECGFDPKCSTRLMFSYRFFLISILFMLFDVEISLMLPIPYMMKSIVGMWVFFIFILILVLGLVYEYYYGSLNWLD